MTVKQIRWRCEQCGDGLLAPMRPRMNDVRRYCLPCSSKTGRLVQRVAPVLEKKRSAKKAVVAKRSARKRATAANRRKATASVASVKRQAERFGEYGMPIQKEAERIWKLLEKRHRGRQLPNLRISWKTTKVDADGKMWFGGRVAGMAFHSDWEIMLKPQPSWATLAHELCHLAVGVGHGHNEVFYRTLKEVYEARWKKHMDWSKVTRFGYIVDRIMEAQINDELQTAWRRKKVEADQR